MNTTRDSIGSSFLSSSMGQKMAGSIAEKSDMKSCCPSLTLKQRIVGFGICTGLGNFTFFYCNNILRINFKYLVIRYIIFCALRKYS